MTNEWIKEVRKLRMLPFPGNVKVEVGQRVLPDTLIAETTLSPEEPYSLSVTEIFGQPPYSIGNFLLKGVGDEVKMGESIARGPYQGQMAELRSPGDGRIELVSPLLGTVSIRLAGDPNEPTRKVDVAKELDMVPLMVRNYLQVRVGSQVKMGQVIAQEPEDGGVCYAPIAGEVVSIEGGVVEIKRPFRPTRVQAYLSGTVTAVTPHLGAEVMTRGALLHGLYGLGGEAYGPLMVLAETPDSVLDEAMLDSSLKGKVLVAGALVTEGAIRRAAELGVAGIISGGLHSHDLVKLLGKEIEVGITGLELVGPTLITMEGMGRVPLRQNVFQLLKSLQGQPCSLNGLTQIRAGVIRPEIIITTNDDHVHPTLISSVDTSTHEIGVGSRVRVVREPYFGVSGIVEEVPALPHTFESGVTTDIYIIRLEGQRVAVARANVEAMLV